MYKKSFQFKLFISFVLFGLVVSSFTILVFMKIVEDSFLSYEIKNFNEVFQFIAFLVFLLSLFLAYFLSKPFSRTNKKLIGLNSELNEEVDKTSAKLSSSLDLVDRYVLVTKIDKEGLILFVSEAFCKISGYLKEELEGKPYHLLQNCENFEEMLNMFYKEDFEEEVYSGEIENSTKEGNKYWLYCNIAPFYENGKIKGLMAVCEDITSKKRLKNLNIELEDKVKDEVEKNIVQHNKYTQDRIKTAQLTSIGHLAAGIVHEINTPLTFIKGNMEMIKYNIEDFASEELKDSLQKDLEKVDNGIERIENIVATMKEVSQTNQEKTTQVNIYETLIIALNMIDNRAKQISQIYINQQLFNTKLDKNELIYNCKVQKQRLVQLWMIILNNSLDVLEKNDKYDERKITIEIKRFEKNIIIKIIDNGGGIPKTCIDKIFDPVFSTKKHGGLGVGLNIAKKIVDDQKAKIKAYNEENKAIFEVVFNED